MSDTWIGWIRQTDEPFLGDGTGTKLLDYIPCNQGAGVLVDQGTHPKLWQILTDAGVATEVPDMPNLTGSSIPYKIIADKT